MTAACLAHVGMLSMVLFAVHAPLASPANRVALAVIAVGATTAVCLSWASVAGWVP